MKTDIDLHSKEADAESDIQEAKAVGRKGTTNPIVILLGILVFAMVLTFVLDSGAFDRQGKLVIPGSYEVIEKDRSLESLFAVPQNTADDSAKPVGLVGTLMAIPKGLSQSAACLAYLPGRALSMPGSSACWAC